MSLDAKLVIWLNHFTGKSSLFDHLVVFLAAYSQYVLAVIFILLLYFSAYSRRQKFYIFGVTLISAAVARLGITELIRFFYHRPRPFVAYQTIRPLISENEWSFPSGHSAFFFAMATALFFYNKKWGIWFFIAALAMNLSRIVAGAHYLSDILGGMVIGILTASVVFYLAEKKTKVINGQK